MPGLFRDLRHTIRQLRNSPGFSITAVLTLSIAIGLATTLFSVVQAVLLRPLPFRDPSRLFILYEKVPSLGIDWPFVPAPDVIAYSRDTRTLAALGASRVNYVELSGISDPIELYDARVTAETFTTLGVRPLLGRTFTQDEELQGDALAVLSYGFWQSRFHGIPSVVGQQVSLDRKPYTVIGVMPRDFEFPLMPGIQRRVQLWVPMNFTPDELTRGAGAFRYTIILRVKPGVSARQAEAELDSIGEEIVAARPAFAKSLGATSVHLNPLDSETTSQVRTMLAVLFAAVTTLLAIACANVTGLLLVRAIRREREFATRLALGASTGALIRQSVTESLTIWIAGGLLGLMLARSALTAVVNLLPNTLPQAEAISIDRLVIGFAFGITLVTGVLCGLIPVLALPKTDFIKLLREGGFATTATRRHVRLRSILVVAEIAAALVLLTGGGLLLRSFEQMRNVNMGFQPENVTTAGYALPKEKYQTQLQVDSFNEGLLRHLREIPGVQAAGLSSSLPMQANGVAGFTLERPSDPHGNPTATASFYVVLGDYFGAVRVHLLRGRLLTEADNNDAPLVTVVNQAFAERHWPGRNPLGERLRLGSPEMLTPWITVVGEVANVKEAAPDDPDIAQYYVSVPQTRSILGSEARPIDVILNRMNVVVRSALPPEAVQTSIQQIARTLDPELALSEVGTLEQAVSKSESPRRFTLMLFVCFATGATVLAALGIYALIAFSVVQRQREIGIRMALGGQPEAIIRKVLGSGVRLTVLGCCVGLAGCIAASKFLGALLFRVSPFDPLVFVCAAAGVTLVGVVAAYFPARRAALVDPMEVLRTE